MSALLFISGLAAGSFLNVVAGRYRPDKFLFARAVIGGRSACPHCHVTLSWQELIPLVSFFVQGGRCLHCARHISWRYPTGELLGGFIFVLVPPAVRAFFPWFSPALLIFLSSAWIGVFLALMLAAMIDIRLQIIPDEVHVLLVLPGLYIVTVSTALFGPTSGSFLGPYALLFGARGNIWFNRALAVAVNFLVLWLLVLTTRGRGMGWGDVKLAAALAVPFGWPDSLLALMLAFIVGSFYSVGVILFKRGNLKSFLPFGPFLAVSAWAVFGYGQAMLAWYFSLFPLI